MQRNMRKTTEWERLEISSRKLEAMTRDSVAAWMVVSTEMGIGEDRVGGVDAVGIGNLVSEQRY